jgi:predicted acylesterase/phospholipase RssA
MISDFKMPRTPEPAGLDTGPRYCDLVMKGGITSGIVYPPAISKLSRKYHFKNIGGTSAGAIAAAVTAAAEYRRREHGILAGFDLLDGLPEKLGETDKRERTRLLRLFQPDATCRRLFGILVGSLNARSTWRRILAILRSALQSYLPATLTGLALAVAAYGLSRSWTAAVLALILAVPALVGFAIYRDLTRTLVANNYGMCKGLTTQTGEGEALTSWLHELIQQAADLKDNEPLTFGHLWDAQGAPPGTPKSTGRSIDLRMLSTNLAHGRPYIFPHTEPMARLFFNPDELQAYLPALVMEWFNRHSLEYKPNAASPESDPTVAEALKEGLREIPLPKNFPVLLAARMSLSFPLLFSAVPLWAIDYEQPKGKRTFHRCMFSDGGISSNFPVHLFDGLIPQWPTFGIDLEAKLPDNDEMVFLPQRYLEGVADRWTRFDQKPRAPSRMGGFLSSVANTMQNWNDNTLSRMTGVRDRVVRVRLAEEEGGMNLNMPADLIRRVADRGRNAAERIIEKFLPSGPTGWDGWSSQRWIRLDAHLNALGQKTAGMQRALSPTFRHGKSYEALVALARGQCAPGHDKLLSVEEAEAVQRLIDGLQAIAARIDNEADRYANLPVPPAELRAGPPL